MVSDSRTDYLGDVVNDVNECAPRSIDRVIEILVELYDLKLRYELHHEYLIQRTMHVTYDQMQQPMIVSIDAILIIKNLQHNQHLSNVKWEMILFFSRSTHLVENLPNWLGRPSLNIHGVSDLKNYVVIDHRQ